MATQTRVATTDAIQMLIDDHNHVKELFSQFARAGERAFKTKQRLAEQIFEELEIHTRLEEEIFYPAARAASDKEHKELVDEGLEEHHVVDLLIAELKQMSPEDDRYDAKMTVLCENVEHHIQEEEEEMLPDARQRLGGRIESLGQEMRELKGSLKQSAP